MNPVIAPINIGDKGDVVANLQAALLDHECSRTPYRGAAYPTLDLEGEDCGRRELLRDQIGKLADTGGEALCSCQSPDLSP